MITAEPAALQQGAGFLFGKNGGLRLYLDMPE